jgi:uncharacterized protein (TIGR03435 family)
MGGVRLWNGGDSQGRDLSMVAGWVAGWSACSLKLGKMRCNVALTVAVTLPVLSGTMHAHRAMAQTPTPSSAAAASAAPASAPDLTGTWQGTLHPGHDLRTVLKITKAADGSHKSDFYSIDQGAQPLPVDKTTLDGGTVKLSLKMIGGTYEGKLSADGKTITGQWSQGGDPLPLILERATAETEWAIPKPPPPIPPMAANADPSFEVATIKPSKPDDQRKAFIVQGNEFHIINQPLTQIISFAFDVQAKQIIGLPDWGTTDKYDIEGKPDGTGAPSGKQWKTMIQKLLADRFGLKFHKDKREMSVYVLSVAKTGEKMTKNDSAPDGLPGLFFRGLGKLGVRNALMTDFTGLMQSAVLDRPVLDQTGLTGRYDFQLNWTPDDSQFGGMGAKVPPPTDAADAPPNLYTAIQEQIGLKLEATKAPADVMVIDHAEKPSAN